MAVTTAIVLGGVYVAGKTTQAIVDNKKANDAQQDAKEHEREIKRLEDIRQEFINPYENIQNEYANIGVATQAAEFQAEEADVALANTLDTLMATGAGAGGATALAQAALRSKAGISASLEQQEAANERLRAQGAMEVGKLKAAGEEWKWEKREARELQKLNREQGLMEADLAEEMQRRQNARDSINSLIDLTGDAASLAAGQIGPG
jgi:hypothetical protein